MHTQPRTKERQTSTLRLCRPEAHEVIQNLRKRGVKNIVLISGDHKAPTKKLAEKLGMDDYFAEYLPQDKSNYIRNLQKKGLKVAMVGDGINDGAALSLADVSISLKGASDVAIDSADVIFMDGNLAKLDQLFDISHLLKRDLNRSFKMIVIPNVICIVGSLMGIVNINMSLVLNNVFNMLAVTQATIPLYDYSTKQIPNAKPK
ncbi:MAG: HAD-IC family P-type ATPase [Bacteroidetes bacterium]|nr:HAD-IC family P-type ATPase [Bacteroidota bacterium]